MGASPDEGMMEVDRKIDSYIVKQHSRGFSSARETIYQTDYTRIDATSFFIPDKDGRIVQFNLTVLKFARKKTTDNFQLVQGYSSEKQAMKDGSLVFDLRSKSGGDSVLKLTKFLNAQFEMIGQKIEGDRVVIDKPVEFNLADFEESIKKLSVQKIEDVTYTSKIELLKKYCEFLINNIDSSEKVIQDWLDEDDGKFRNQRCHIFGLEYIDHKREGQMEGKRFDILTRASVSSLEYVLIELKSPSADVFGIKNKMNDKGGTVSEYSLSKELSRAIPQILSYRKKFENLAPDSEDLQRIGVEGGYVGKCLIVIGKRVDDPVWQSNFDNLRKSVASNLEIITYTDLIDKLTLTIDNLSADHIIENG